jgi:hypothetical protein
MNLIEIFTLIIGHYVADFILQDVKWANNKSTSNKALLMHTLTYASFWLILALSINVYVNVTTGHWAFNVWAVQMFVLYTFILHTATDYITSRIVKNKFKKQEYGTSLPNTGAFSVIGFDQVLHYLQLFLTYEFLINEK